jgi:poly(3-hydroxybutyrate) depolymerase
MSNLRRFAAATSSSSAGRRSFDPETPRSTNSIAVHPLASQYRHHEPSKEDGFRAVVFRSGNLTSL